MGKFIEFMEALPIGNFDFISSQFFVAWIALRAEGGIDVQ